MTILIMWKQPISLVFLILISNSVSGERLRVSGQDFYFGNDQVFLSGANIAWNCYGCDFGNNGYDNSKSVLEEYVRRISFAGGNSLRIWIHVEGETTPEFNSDGYVVGTDGGRTLIGDLGRFLDYAQIHNVFVIPVLWNGALMRQQNLVNLAWDDSKLQSYIDNALVPMVKALAGKPALGAWEIMNEPEGSILVGERNTNECYDTSRLSGSGAGWTGRAIPMERMAKFLAKQVAAIREADPGALVTIGSWSERPQTDAFPETYNYYKDSCMVHSGGSKAIIDFFQIHTYSWEGRWADHSPFRISAMDFRLEKPLVIGEFASICAEDESIEQLFDHGYNRGYKGLWTWQYNAGGECSDSQSTQDIGMNHIRHYNHNGLVAVTIR